MVARMDMRCIARELLSREDSGLGSPIGSSPGVTLRGSLGGPKRSRVQDCLGRYLPAHLKRQTFKIPRCLPYDCCEESSEVGLSDEPRRASSSKMYGCRHLEILIDGVVEVETGSRQAMIWYANALW